MITPIPGTRWAKVAPRARRRADDAAFGYCAKCGCGLHKEPKRCSECGESVCRRCHKSHESACIESGMLELLNDTEFPL